MRFVLVGGSDVFAWPVVVIFNGWSHGVMDGYDAASTNADDDNNDDEGL